MANKNNRTSKQNLGKSSNMVKSGSTKAEKNKYVSKQSLKYGQDKSNSVPNNTKKVQSLVSEQSQPGKAINKDAEAMEDEQMVHDSQNSDQMTKKRKRLRKNFEFTDQNSEVFKQSPNNMLQKESK